MMATRQKFPALQIDSINLEEPHLARTEKVDEIVATVTEKHRVVIGGSPSTGKSSLLELLGKRVKDSGDETLQIDMVDNEDAAARFFTKLREKYSISEDRESTVSAFRQRTKKLWVLIDEAQNAYTPQFDGLWAFLFKTLVKYPMQGKLLIAVASTYDETLGPSPVYFEGIDHVSPHASQAEAANLYNLHTQHWNQMHSWGMFLDDLLSHSWMDEGEQRMDEGESKFHFGVMMAGIFMLSSNCKRTSYTEEDAMSHLRSQIFVSKLDRCFTKPKTLPLNVKEAIFDSLMGASMSTAPVPSSDEAYQFVRRGLLNEYGGFSCLAAHRYYNTYFFPGRAITAPASLDNLVIEAFKSMSKHRLQASRDGGNFPKEAALQQLFNEEANRLLPPRHSLIPELNTKATKNGVLVTGELDFYVNAELKWSIELLKEGIGIGAHLARFHRTTGKYREVDTREYIVVDLRGPRTPGRGVNQDPNRCTFYFGEDFSVCICKMRLRPEFRFELQP